MRVRAIWLKPQRDIEFFGCTGAIAFLAQEIGQLYMS